MNKNQFHISLYQSDLLDLARWLAALLVVVEHLRCLMFVSYEDVKNVNILYKSFYFFTNFGHTSVMVFFVMSGFLVGGKVFERLALGTFSIKKYFIDRSSRLYAVYLLALVIGGSFDYFGFRFLNNFGLYNQSFEIPIMVIDKNIYESLSISNFALNALMLQTIKAPVFGSNGPLWSLANEFWYYLAGPLILGCFFIRRLTTFGLVVLAISLIFYILPMSIIIYFFVWLIGPALFLFNSRSYLPTWMALLLFVGTCIIARIHLVQIPYLFEFFIGTAFALLINSAAGIQRRLPMHAWNRKLADFSYSVYLCHLPFAMFILSAVYQTTGIGLRELPTVKQALYFLFILFFTYVWCYAVSLLTERQTPRIREWLHRKLFLSFKSKK